MHIYFLSFFISCSLMAMDSLETDLSTNVKSLSYYILNRSSEDYGELNLELEGDMIRKYISKDILDLTENNFRRSIEILDNDFWHRERPDICAALQKVQLSYLESLKNHHDLPRQGFHEACQYMADKRLRPLTIKITLKRERDDHEEAPKPKRLKIEGATKAKPILISNKTLQARARREILAPILKRAWLLGAYEYYEDYKTSFHVEKRALEGDIKALIAGKDIEDYEGKMMVTKKKLRKNEHLVKRHILEKRPSAFLCKTHKFGDHNDLLVYINKMDSLTEEQRIYLKKSPGYQGRPDNTGELISECVERLFVERGGVKFDNKPIFRDACEDKSITSLSIQGFFHHINTIKEREIKNNNSSMVEFLTYGD